MRRPFQFKNFAVQDTNSPMKVNTDAVLLGSWAVHPDPKTILDIGTGCGVIALMLAQRTYAKITAIDIDKGAIEDASQNFDNSPWASRLEAVNLDFAHYQSDHKFDLIVSNPPYFENSLKSPFSERNLSRHNDHLNHQQLLSGCTELIKDDGIFAVILPTDVFAKFESEALVNKLFLHRICHIRPTEHKAPNRILAEFRKSIAIQNVIDELVLFHPNRKPTDAYKKLTSDFYPAF